jgi:hypothetical protein
MITAGRSIMTRTETPGGTPVLELDGDEYQQFLEGETQARMGMSVAEFTERYLGGELDDADPDVPLLAGLLWIGQDGRAVAA